MPTAIDYVLRKKEIETERYILSTRPVLYLPLDRLGGTAFHSKDINGHLCTVTGATWGSQGRTFDGIDDLIDCGASASLNIATAISLEAWVKPAENKDSYQVIFYRRLAGTDYPILLEVRSQFSRFRLRGSVAEIGDLSTAAGTVPVNTRSHVVGTYDGTNMYIFVNGVQRAIVAGTGTILQTTESLYIGNNEGASLGFQSVIGEIRVYNRALSTTEIMRLYQTTKWRYQ